MKYKFIVVAQKRCTLMRLISSSARKPKEKLFLGKQSYLSTLTVREEVVDGVGGGVGGGSTANSSPPRLLHKESLVISI